MQKPKRYDLDKLGFLVSDRWRVYKQIVGERSGYKCEFCKIRMMDTAHHRINERPLYGYDQPPLLDLMAICFVCHEFIHRDTSTKTDKPKFGVNSPGDLKDRGFSTSNDTPGHWKKFWPENPWKAILPNHGQVIYQAYKEDFSNGNIKLILSDKDNEVQVFKWDEVKDDLSPIVSADDDEKILDAHPVRVTWCRACSPKKMIDSKSFKMCVQCIGIICSCGNCPCSDPTWHAPFSIL